MSRYGTRTTPDLPAFEVRVAGDAVEAPIQRDVVDIDLAEEVCRHGRLTMLVQNWDADTRTVRHSDDGPFPPGADVEVSLGYHSTLAPVFAGVVTSVTAHFPADGRPVLRVEARSRSVLLAHPARSRQLADVSDADVASAVAADYGLTPDAADGVTRAFVVSDRRSDWDLLTARAAELGWVVYVRDDVLVLRPPAEPGSELIELEYGRNVAELHLTQDITYAVDSVVAAGWDSDAVEPVEAEAGAGRAGIDVGNRPDHATALSDAGWSLREERAARASVASVDEADARAVGRQRSAALGHLYGTGAVVGNPALRCDAWLRITGVGDRMSGPHYVTATRHRLSARGYRTEFQVGRPPMLLPPAPGPATTAGGTPGGTADTPLTVAVVTSVEDPAQANRVQVRMPWRGEQADGVWARLASLDAGDGYGTVFVPDVGQEVLVAPVDGDAATLVVLGSLFNGTQTPPVAVTEAANPVRAVVSPGGHRVLLTDGDASAVTIETPAGDRMQLSDADSEVSLTHGDSGNSIALSADGIAITAARGDVVISSSAGKVKLDGKGLEGTSTGPARIESSATLDVKAAGMLGLKGGVVNIN